MLHLIDRQLIYGYFKAYIVCLTSLLSLYVVVDLFTNMDDFTRHQGGLLESLRLIAVYYGTQVPQYFDRLCEAILLLAAMFTVAWMQRNNEQMPLLAAGVSTHRVVRPVIVSACFMLAVAMANQEFLIPYIGQKLTFQRDDPDGVKDMEVRGAYEPNLIHIEGRSASRKGQVIREFRCTIPEEVAGRIIHLTASEAHYVPPGPGPREGGWELSGAVPPDLDTWDRNTLEPIDQGKYFLRVRQVDFDALTRDQRWYRFASTKQLYDDLQSPDSTRVAAKAVLFHMRLARPILGILLVFLGLSVILRDQNRNVILSAGMCLGLCAVFFAASLLCKFLGDYDHMPPALAAWLPVIFFGPLALVQFDAVHT